MYLRGLSSCNCKPAAGMSGLGDWIDNVLNNLLQSYTGQEGDFGKSGSSTSGAPSNGQGGGSSVGTSVTTNVQTQVSPQISPSFVQQDQPQNSAVTTTAVSAPSGPSLSMNSPSFGTPATGFIPGFDSGFLPNGLAIPLPQTQTGKNVALGAAALFLVGALAYKFRHKLRKSKQAA